MTQKITKLWIDESGDPGFKLEAGSTNFFVVAAVYGASDSFDAQKVSRTLDLAKIKLGLVRDYEFKFSRCRDNVKIEILKSISRVALRYKAVVVDKNQIIRSHYRFTSKSLYAEAIKRLLYDNNPPLSRATIVIDESVVKIHQTEFNARIRRSVSRSVISKIVQKRSRGEVMIQMADLIAGSILRKYEKEDDSYYKLIKLREQILIGF